MLVIAPRHILGITHFLDHSIIEVMTPSSFNCALEDLGKKYPVGLYEYLYKHRPDLYSRLIDLEDTIDKTYLNPNSTIDPLKAILGDYWTFHMTAIKEFKQAIKLDLNLSEVRKEMIEERIRA
jgi:hypothetical protein